jgi:glycosyltransferase involved in cell wall biosynthesis
MKPLFIISCPIDTYSGYGARSRDIVKSIIDLDKYDVKILPQKWGVTPWGYIENHPKWQFLNDHIIIDNKINKQPEIWAQITVPNEFQPVGKYNIGITAGIETKVCDASWIEGMNKMDVNWVSSNHSKNIFLNTQFEKRDSNTNNLLGVVKIEKPIEVVFEGLDIDTYKSIPTKENSIDLSSIKESFAYLFVGHWLNGEVGEDRKNVGLLIKTFLETFKNLSKSPALILKTSGAGASYMDRKGILDKIHAIKDTVKADKLPNIYLFHGELEEEEVNHLYNHPKVKAMVSFTKGEGFGRPLLEFTQTGKPVIASNWSGHLDFLNPKYCTLIEGQLTPVHPSCLVPNIILEDSHWFSPNLMECSSALHKVYHSYPEFVKLAKAQRGYAKNRYTLQHMTELISSLLEECLPDFPESIELKLPELAELKLPELKEL